MAAGVPSTNQITPFSPEALQAKSKLGMRLALPGLFYNQINPTAANVTSGNATAVSGLSLIGALQLGSATAGATALGGVCVVTSVTTSAGALVTTATSNFMPTTLVYDQMPVKFVLGAAGVLPTNLTAGQVYYWQWVSATTGRLALTPNGTVVPFVSDITGVVYIQAATMYWGSPLIPPGFLQAADTLNQATPNSTFGNGCTIRVEILGNATGASTNNSTATVGLIGSTGTFTAGSTVVVARASGGPWGFSITADLIIQQYGQPTIAAPYNAIAQMQSLITLNQPSAAGTMATGSGISVKTVALDLTQAYAVDVRMLQATPAITEYYEPLIVRMWAYN